MQMEIYEAETFPLHTPQPFPSFLYFPAKGSSPHNARYPSIYFQKVTIK